MYENGGKHWDGLAVFGMSKLIWDSQNIMELFLVTASVHIWRSLEMPIAHAAPL